jgi:uncharacterized repeat protein (TIGR01451 family)
LTSLFIFLQAGAQIDAFTYFIPFPTDQLDDLFDIANNDNDLIDEDVQTTISIALRRAGTLIYYDHWEDELESNLTSPVQASTQVWGDDNPANGIPPGFATDVLDAGDIITLQNVVVLPRDRSQFFFDGGDKLTAAGGSIAVSLAVWPERTDVSSLYAGAWEIGSTSFWGTEYLIPVGVDLFGSGPGLRGAWGVVAVNVQAVEDDTQVQLDLDADGSFEQVITLNGGQQFTQTSGDARSGARIRSLNHPVQVHLFTGNPNPGINFEARAYTMLPEDQLANDYLVPRSSDGDHWLYNPHTTPLTVTAATQAGVDTIIIPPQSTAQYPVGALSGPTGVRFTSTDGRSFDGLTALDADFVQDWGYAWYPIDFLTTQVLIGWAPGNNRVPPSSWTGDPAGLTASRVYVTALTTTTLNIEYDLQDPIPDDTVIITPLEEVDVIDPNDYDMTGAVLYTTDGVPIVAVWGQDESAPRAQPSIDVGTGVVPLASMSVQKTITLIDDADGSGDISWGDTLRFEIFTINNTNLILRDAVISDTLPSTVDYVQQSSTVRGEPIPDDSPPRTIFPFDEGGYPVGDLIFPFDEGGYPVGDLQPAEVVTGTFDAIVKDGVEEICNTAGADSPSVPPPGDATACVPVVPSIATPTPTPLPPTSTPTPEPPDTPEPPPTFPPPTATPVISVVTPEPTLPVLYLPETGSGEVQAGLGARGIFLLLVACLAMLGIGARLIQKQTK